MQFNMGLNSSLLVKRKQAVLIQHKSAVVEFIIPLYLLLILPILILILAWSAPSHYLDQSWYIVNWILWNKLQWNSIEILTFSSHKIHLKVLSLKWQPFCIGLDVSNVLITFHVSNWHVQYCADGVQVMSDWHSMSLSFTLLIPFY